MFVSHELMLDISFAEASARLAGLGRGGWLAAASADAYDGGLAGALRVGPFGPLPGLSKLVRVQLLDPVSRAGAVRVPLRWEAADPGGRLFPVLDADLVLLPGGPGRSLLRLDGAYRAPLAELGAWLDRAMLHRVASATIRSLLERIAASVSGPRPEPGRPLAVGTPASADPS